MEFCERVMQVDSYLERVLDIINRVLENKMDDDLEWQGSTQLVDTPLDSLDWAVVVALLEEEFGFDPFRMGWPSKLQTIADLARLYMNQNRV